MCGLAGVFTPAGATPPDVDLGSIIAVMRHRGPDGEGRHLSHDRRFQAAFARLAIIDIAGAEQPIVEPGGTRVLMGNGEIYNYIELRSEIGEDGYPWQTSGDMEVVLPLASRHGDDFVERLNGMYGLALYDRAAHRLTLVRDRLGIKPLYWARLANGGVAFASEIKPLFASGLVPRDVDEDAVNAYLAHGYVPGPATLYRAVRKLRPGFVLTVDADGDVRERCYWAPRPANDLSSEPEEIETRLIADMRDAARLQLRSDVPVGALLSGGLDSGLTVAFAAEAQSEPLHTFTVRFEGAAVDETPLARAVADRYGTRHTEVDVRADDVAGFLPRLAWYADEPLADASLLPNHLIEEVLSGAVKVALNGTGGDELFAGYPRYFQTALERRYLKLPGALRRGLIEPFVAVRDPWNAWRLARAEKFAADRGQYLFDHSTLFPDAARRMIGNLMPSPAAAHAGLARQYLDVHGGDLQGAGLAAEMQTYLVEDLLTLLDRTSMAHGVEGRVPLLDHRIVETALAVPEHVRTPGGVQKALQRRIARHFLPEALIDAPKQGFASPVGAWLRSGLAAPARRLLTRPDTIARGWWSEDGIDRLLADPDTHGPRVYSLLMLELTIHTHVDAPATDTAPVCGLHDLADAA